MRLAFFRRRGARADLRNHRKIAVIDGRVGYTGSMNLVDADFKHGLTYEELMVRVTGPVVLELQAVFVEDWYLERGRAPESGDPFPDPEITGTVAAQVLPSSPLYPTENNQRVIVALVNGARTRAVITTPYFIPDAAVAAGAHHRRDARRRRAPRRPRRRTISCSSPTRRNRTTGSC